MNRSAESHVRTPPVEHDYCIFCNAADDEEHEMNCPMNLDHCDA